MSMAYAKYPANTFKSLVIGAGVLLSDFDPEMGTVSDANIIGPTSSGVNFQATPSYIDFGEDIDNVPKNTKELKRIEDWEVKMTGDFIAITPALAKILAAAADLNGNQIVPRDTLDIASDFHDIWLVADYSDVNTGANAGFVAIKMMDALSTGGFQIQTTDKEKGKFSFEFTAHYSKDAADTVPFEIWIRGNDGTVAGILLNTHSVTMDVGDTVKLTAKTVPSNATVTWASDASTNASVSGGTVTGVAVGSAIITASITQSGVTYNDTCTVVVKSAS